MHKRLLDDFKSATAKRYTLIGLSALFSIMIAHMTSAAVSQETEPKPVVVRYSDLDLSSLKDAQRLYGRIKRAARIACESPPTSELLRLAKYQSCLRQSIAAAVARVRSSQLDNILQAETRHAPRG
jgi:UrcA family protein